MVNELLKTGGRDPQNELVSRIAALDEKLRKQIADLYLTLEESGNSLLAVEVLAEHVTILVEMINHFKTKKTP